MQCVLKTESIKLIDELNVGNEKRKKITPSLWSGSPGNNLENRDETDEGEERLWWDTHLQFYFGQVF